MFTEINIPYHLPRFVFGHREIIQMETSGNLFPILFNTLFTAQLHLVLSKLIYTDQLKIFETNEKS